MVVGPLLPTEHRARDLLSGASVHGPGAPDSTSSLGLAGRSRLFLLVTNVQSALGTGWSEALLVGL